MKAHKRQLFISIVMPVYNAGNFLVESIESIRRQTHQHFEFIVVDDASTDDTWKILKKYRSKDKRIKLIRNTRHEGVSSTVKRAIKQAKGRYLARMDADDISVATRLEKEVNYLAAHASTVAVGTQCEIINRNGVVIGTKLFPTEFADIYKYISLFVPLQQPTLMIDRRRLPKDFQYYRDGMNTAEEVELIFKLFQYGRVENLLEVLHQYRVHGDNTSLLDVRKTFLLTLLSRWNAVLHYGYQPTISGIMVNIVECFAVLLLPKTWSLRIYATAKTLLSDLAIRPHVQTLQRKPVFFGQYAQQ